MAISSASVSSIEYTPQNPYKGVENVLNLAKDEKLKLQMEIKEVQRNLDKLKNDALNKQLDDRYQDLLTNDKADLIKLRGEIKSEIVKNKIDISLDEIHTQIETKLADLETNSLINQVAEDQFDLWILDNTGKYKTEEELEIAFTSMLKTGEYREPAIDQIKNAEIENMLQSYKFEVMNLEFDFENQAIAAKEKGHESIIGPDISVQATKPIEYSAVANMTPKERKEAGFVDNYRDRQWDKKTAIRGILDELNDEKLNKQLARINTDNFVAILDDIVSDPVKIGGQDFLDYIKSQSMVEGEIDEKEFKEQFKKEFKKQFIDTGKYEKKGIKLVQFNEKNILARIFLEYINQTEQGETGLQKEFERLPDAAKQGIRYTGEHNAELMLKETKSQNVREYLCDFNSDGKVDSSKTGGDFGSIMGLQLYEDFIYFADTEWDKNNKIQIIKDGPDTSQLIEKILIMTASFSDNEQLKNYINYFLNGGEYVYTDKKGENQTITLKSGKEGENYTIENFFKFMQQKFEFGITDSRQKTIIKNEIKTPAVYDIKEFLKAKGEIINEQKDVSEVFGDKEQNKSKTYEEVTNLDIKFDKYKNYNKFAPAIYGELNNNADRLKLREEISAQSQENISEMESRTVDRVLTTAMTITDYIFLNMGNRTETWANMFSQALGGISQSFYKEKGGELTTRNQQEIRDGLMDYIIKNITLSVARDENGKISPVIGASIGFDKVLQTDKGRLDRVAAQLPVGFFANLRNFKNAKFMISPSIEYARQINQKKVEKLGKAKLIPVNRIGIEAGAGFELSHFKNIVPYAGMFFERDYASAINQELDQFEEELGDILGMKKSHLMALGYEVAGETYTDKNDFLTKINNKIKSDQNKEYLSDVIDQLADFMERSGTFELIQEHPADQDKILNYVYSSFIAGYKDLIKQNKSIQLEKRVKFTKIGVRFSPIEIARSGGFMGATMVSAEISKFKTYYEKDVDKSIKNYKSIGNMRGLNTVDERPETLTSYAAELEKDLNCRIKYLNVTADEANGNLAISPVEKTKNVLDSLNVYYSQEAYDNGLFKYDGSKLLLGDVEFSTYKVVNQDSVEVFLMIGNNLSGPLKQLKSPDAKLKAGLPPKIEKEPAASIPLTLETLKTKELKVTGKDSLVSEAVNNAYQSWLDTNPTLPANFVNGTIQVTKDANGKFSFTIDSIPSAANADNNKITLQYIVERTNRTDIPETYYNKTNLAFEMSYEGYPVLLYAQKEIDALVMNDKIAGIEYKDLGNQILKPQFNKFMEYIMDNNLDNAVTNLKAILITDNTFASIIQSLNKGNNKTKAYIVDRFLEIFAYETKYQGKDIGTILDLHSKGGEYYLDLLKGTNVLRQEMKAARKAIKDKLAGEKYDYKTTEKHPEIIGYTSFYRKGTDTGAHGYGLTALGDTKIVSDSIKELTTQDAKIWLADKFAKEKEENSTFAKNIKDKLHAKGIDISGLDNDEVCQLIRGEVVSLDNNKKKISLDVKCIFYLLGECANESIGLQIEGINVWEYNPSLDKDLTKYEGSISPDQLPEAYAPKWKKSILNSDYDTFIRSQKLGVGTVVARIVKAPGAEAYPGEGREASNDNSSTGGGEGRDEGNMKEGGSGSE